jgi:hypothetical protein
MDFAGRFGVERHAQQCLACGRLLKDAVRLNQMAREMRRVQAPPEFETALLARIQAVKVRRRSSKLWKLWVFGLDQVSWRAVAFGTASAALIVFAVFALVRNGDVAGLAWLNRSASPAVEDSAAARSAVAPDRHGPAGSGWEILDPQILPVGDPGARYFLGEDWTSRYLDPADMGFVDYPIPGEGEQQLIMRLPRSIRLRYGQPSRDYFIRNVSH